jgi:dihydrofolate reductase/thymidylate synthase
VEYQFLTYRHRGLHGLARSCRPTGAPGAARHEEHQYLDQIRDIIATGLPKEDRTGVGTISKFGMTSRWSLRDDVFPLLTTKRVFWRGVAEELLWFISGSTSAKALQDKGVHIWDGNGSREFLDKSGLGHRETGDLGPVYGFQWRHFGAPYADMHADYAGKGVDQLAEVVHKLRNNPTDRRIVLSAWNPAAIKEMALPPCHMFAQFLFGLSQLASFLKQQTMHQPAIGKGGVLDVQAGELAQGLFLLGQTDQVPGIAQSQFGLHLALHGLAQQGRHLGRGCTDQAQRQDQGAGGR